MKTHLPIFLFFLLTPLFSKAASDDAPTAVPSPTPQAINHFSDTAKALVVHKPKPSPAWGRVIQYRRMENFVLADNQRETLYEFVFQDDAGIVRTATYHENTSGDGYWEVWVWDQP